MSEKPFHSPFAALVWKEWRESWWLLALTLVWPAAWTIVPRVFPAPDSFGVIMYVLVAVGVFGLALSLGAGLFASERARGTDAFQHERPIGRGTIWNAKLLLPILAMASGAILLGIVALRKWPEPWGGIDPPVGFFLLIMWFLSFISAVLCSVLLDRPVTAGAAGGVLCVSTAGGQALLLDHFIGWNGSSEHMCWLVFLCLLVVEAIGLLWLSRVAYVRWMHD